MRSNKEILQICIDNIEPIFVKENYKGLCFYIEKLWLRHNLITEEEYEDLIELLNSNPPFFVKLRMKIYKEYWWERKDSKSRLKYLKRLLKKYEKDNS
jgi:hypothetical protein